MFFLSCAAYAKDVSFSKVINKFREDTVAVEQFRYLGILHCLDDRVYLDKNIRPNQNKLFVNAYIELDSNLFGLPRLITQYALDKNFSKFQT